MGDFTGKVALVTGGGAGIGRATILAFAREGAKVIVADRDEQAGRECVALAEKGGAEAVFLSCDVSKDESVDAMFDQAIAQWGRIDCAVNNAAIDPELSLDPTWEIALFDRLHSSNVRSVVMCMKREIDHMVEHGGGAIVNIGSFASLAGIPSKPFYVATKHAVLGLTRSAALRYARDKVLINAVCPGTTRTAILQANIDLLPEGEAYLNARIPAGRSADPSEIADAVLYLCSSKATYIVGHALSVDGGLSAQ